jgi:hypothetical protein
MKTPTNVKELRADLLEAYAMLKADPKRHNQVKELSNTAGKILGSLKIELEYAAIRGEQPNIPFISDGLAIEPQKPRQLN